jgi:hypothetical protein
MVGTATSPDAQVGEFQDFIRAGISELNRLVGNDPTGARTHSKLPSIPQVAQLSMFLMLIAKGIEPKHVDIYPHRNRLTEHLDKVYKKSRLRWEEAIATKSQSSRENQLHDTRDVQPHVAVLVRYAEKTFGLNSRSLRSFGVTDVQAALGALIKKVADATERQLQPSTRGRGAKAARKDDVPDPKTYDGLPGPVLGGLLVASVAGDAGMQGKFTRDQVMAMRVGVGIGTGKPDPAKPESKVAKELRRTLKSLATHVSPTKP